MLRLRNVYPHIPDLNFFPSLIQHKKRRKNQLNEQAKKKIRVHWQRIFNVKNYKALRYMGFIRDPRSGITKKTYSGSRIQGWSKNRIFICNNTASSESCSYLVHFTCICISLSGGREHGEGAPPQPGGSAPLPLVDIQKLDPSKSGDRDAEAVIPFTLFFFCYIPLCENSPLLSIAFKLLLGNFIFFFHSQTRFYTWETSVPMETQTLRGHSNFCCFSFVKIL